VLVAIVALIVVGDRVLAALNGYLAGGALAGDRR